MPTNDELKQIAHENISITQTPEDMWELITNFAMNHNGYLNKPGWIDYTAATVVTILRLCRKMEYTREQTAIVLAFNALARLQSVHEEYGRLMNLIQDRPLNIKKEDIP